MLEHSFENVEELQKLTGLSEAELQTPLDRLRELGLLRQSKKDPMSVHVVAPDVGIPPILAGRRARLATEQQRLEAAELAAADLIAEYTSANGYHRVEQLNDLDEIRDRIRLLTSNARQEVMAFVPDGAQTAENMENAGPQDADLLARGVGMRTLYLHSMRNDPPTFAYANWLTEQGAGVRTVVSLPTRLLIIDRTTAVVPVHGEDSSSGAIVTRVRGILVALCALFDLTWKSAIPLHGRNIKQCDDNGLSNSETEVLRLLASGHTDDVIARRIGVSARTARRMAADLMLKLNARSRFQAGTQAALRGWITVDDTISSR